VTIAKGFICDRMFQRWRPSGTGPIKVIRVVEESPGEILPLVSAAIGELTSD